MKTQTENTDNKSALNAYKVFQLPNRYKKIGYVIFVSCFIGMFACAFLGYKNSIKEFIELGILIGLLIVSISKDPLEDERVIKLRMQSYSFAFIAGMLLILSQTIVGSVIDLSQNKSIDSLFSSGDWVILWILLFTQVFVFEMLKRRG